MNFTVQALEVEHNYIKHYEFPQRPIFPFFGDKVSQCSLDWSGTQCVDQVVLELTDIYLYLPPEC